MATPYSKTVYSSYSNCTILLKVCVLHFQFVLLSFTAMFKVLIIVHITIVPAGGMQCPGIKASGGVLMLRW